jgi:hypothetical protein
MAMTAGEQGSTSIAPAALELRRANSRLPDAAF